MQDVVLIIGTSLEFLFGWFLMKRLACFLDENQKKIEEASEQQSEPCVYVDGDISPDKLEAVISRFRSTHTHIRIMVYDPGQISFSSSKSDFEQ